jgi:hypothetical protein
MKKIILLLSLSTLGLTGCDTIDSHSARKAQLELVGMHRTDFFACAGVPNRSERLDGLQYDTYDYQPYTPDDSLSATLPLIGGIGIGSSGNCHATAIYKDNILQALNYSGLTGGPLGHVSECVAIVSHCRDGARAATGKY